MDGYSVLFLFYISKMDTNKKIIAAFDFDGTLTQCDTLSLFIIHSLGWFKFIGGLLILTPILISYILRFISNERAKRILFCYYFKGMDYKTFCEYGNSFSKKIELIKNKPAMEQFLNHKKLGHKVYIISASMNEWILPWANLYQIDDIITTNVEVNVTNKLTGNFTTPNCYGLEKVKRFTEIEPMRESYYLYAYGNSSGDIPLLNFADERYLFKASTKQKIHFLLKYFINTLKK